MKTFQSTLPRGERRPHAQTKAQIARVSIHAPTGGATRRVVHNGKRRGGFNPRSHGGSDSLYGLNVYDCNGFNPRSHGGSDL